MLFCVLQNITLREAVCFEVYWLTPWSRVLPQMLTTPQIVKKFLTFYAARMFITAFTSARHPSLSSATPPRFLKFHFQIIVPSKSRSSKWSPSLRFLCQNSVCTSPLSHKCLMPHQSHPNHPNDTCWKELRLPFSTLSSHILNCPSLSPYIMSETQIKWR